MKNLRGRRTFHFPEEEKEKFTVYLVFNETTFLAMEGEKDNGHLSLTKKYLLDLSEEEVDALYKKTYELPEEEVEEAMELLYGVIHPYREKIGFGEFM